MDCQPMHNLSLISKQCCKLGAILPALVRHVSHCARVICDSVAILPLSKSLVLCFIRGTFSFVHSFYSFHLYIVCQ